jgi:hypothetical protein
MGHTSFFIYTKYFRSILSRTPMNHIKTPESVSLTCVDMLHVSSHWTALYPATRGSAASCGGELTVAHHNGDASRTSARVGVYSPCQQEQDPIRTSVAGEGFEYSKMLMQRKS